MLKNSQRLRIVSRSDNNLEENLVDLFRCLRVDRSVRNQDSTKSGNRITSQGLFPCLQDITTGSDTTSVIMFQDSESQLIELVDQVHSRINIKQVVIGDLLTMNLLEHIIEFAIELSRLMRILTITQVHRLINRRTEMRTRTIVEIVENS